MASRTISFYFGGASKPTTIHNISQARVSGSSCIRVEYEENGYGAVEAVYYRSSESLKSDMDKLGNKLAGEPATNNNDLKARVEELELQVKMLMRLIAR
jgi:hypothetical protein